MQVKGAMRMKTEMDRRRKVRTALPMLLFMAVIFSFSAKTADESTRSSDAVVDVIMGGEQYFFGTPSEQAERYAQLTFLVRKGAHMAEYAVLAALALYWLSSFELPYRRRCAFAALISVCYAATDEFHQLFVEGRSGQASDVLIDSAGALLGLLAVSLIRCAAQRRRRPREPKQEKEA